MLTEIRDVLGRKTYREFGVDVWDDTDVFPTSSYYEYICPDKSGRMHLMGSDGHYIQCTCGREYERDKVLIDY